MSHAGCPGPSPASSAQFTLKICVAARNRKKITKTLILKVQGHLKSSPLTPIKSLSLLLVMLSCIFVPICYRIHATRASCNKIITF